MCHLAGLPACSVQTWPPQPPPPGRRGHPGDPLAPEEEHGYGRARPVKEAPQTQHPEAPQAVPCVRREAPVLGLAATARGPLRESQSKPASCLVGPESVQEPRGEFCRCIQLWLQLQTVLASSAEPGTPVTVPTWPGRLCTGMQLLQTGDGPSPRKTPLGAGGRRACPGLAPRRPPPPVTVSCHVWDAQAPSLGGRPPVLSAWGPSVSPGAPGRPAVSQTGAGPSLQSDPPWVRCFTSSWTSCWEGGAGSGTSAPPVLQGPWGSARGPADIQRQRSGPRARAAPSVV